MFHMNSKNDWGGSNPHTLPQLHIFLFIDRVQNHHQPSNPYILYFSIFSFFLCFSMFFPLGGGGGASFPEPPELDRQNDGGYRNDVFPMFFRQRDVRKFDLRFWRFLYIISKGGGRAKMTEATETTFFQGFFGKEMSEN